MLTHIGTLNAVTALQATILNATSTLLTWIAPFSHVFLFRPPHIRYCIEVWNTHGLPLEYGNLINTACRVESTSFSVNLESYQLIGCYGLVYIVTPVNAAGNGMKALVSEVPSTFPNGNIIIFIVFSTFCTYQCNTDSIELKLAMK